MLVLYSVMLGKSLNSTLSGFRHLQMVIISPTKLPLANHPHFFYYFIFKLFSLRWSFYDVSAPLIIWCSEFHGVLDVVKSAKGWGSSANRAEFRSHGLMYLFSKYLFLLCHLFHISITQSLTPSWFHRILTKNGRTGILIRDILFY